MVSCGALSVAGTACRADVEGDYNGLVGTDSAFLVLEQEGAQLDGELCLMGSCEAIIGGVDEGRIKLDVACASCSIDGLGLRLDVKADRLEGYASVPDCGCEQSDPCDCKLQARFWPP